MHDFILGEALAGGLEDRSLPAGSRGEASVGSGAKSPEAIKILNFRLKN